MEKLLEKVNELLEVDAERKFLEELSAILRAEVLELIKKEGKKKAVTERGLVELRKRAVEELSAEAKEMLKQVKDRLKAEGKVKKKEIEYLSVKIFGEDTAKRA